MKLFVGSWIGAKPEGYTTIDIEPQAKPDILADAAELTMIADGAADEFHASHVLEHFAWPRALLVLREWARVLKLGGVLKVAVPDMAVYGAMLARGENVYGAMASIYGGHWLVAGGPQGHHYGFTRQTLTDFLILAGFGQFGTWTSDYPEAANGWIWLDNDEHVAISLNISAVKVSEPIADLDAIYARCKQLVTDPLPKVVREVSREAADRMLAASADIDAVLYQSLHMRLIEQTFLNKHYVAEAAKLQQELAALRHEVATLQASA